ncbi:MAG: dihydrofolate reductase [Bernardetiaceae bacterium]
MQINLIVAQSTNRVIGKDNALPWHLPADLKRFRRLTMGHYLLMGRKTFVSIGRVLPGRTSVVLTQNPDFPVPEGVHRVHTPEAGIVLARESGAEQLFVLGGGEVFAQTLDWADKLYLTQIHAHIEGDTFFPVIDAQKWALEAREDFPADAQQSFAYSFIDYTKKNL